MHLLSYSYASNSDSFHPGERTLPPSLNPHHLLRRSHHHRISLSKRDRRSPSTWAAGQAVANREPNLPTAPVQVVPFLCCLLHRVLLKSSEARDSLSQISSPFSPSRLKSIGHYAHVDYNFGITKRFTCFANKRRASNADAIVRWFSCLRCDDEV